MKDNFNILVVDDNQENLRVVSNYLKEAGFRIALALDGKSAMEIIKNNSIDLVLLDIMMPEMDGFEVCKILKSKSETFEIPVIFLTAKNDTYDIVRAFRLGGVDYITKPFKKEELLARVSNHLQLKMYREWYKDQVQDQRNANYTFLRNMLEFGKIIDPEN